MALFKNYTGNAMLNNALITIEILAKLSTPREITTDLLKSLLKSLDLVSYNKRFKSYTMLFTRNGPLHNDRKNGERIYTHLINKIIEKSQEEGDTVCEISGLKFKHSFESIYINTLRELGFSQKEIEKKDTTIGRTWFPLIGGLGSDAQALQQAKFATEIHPICIAIMQFLPFSSVLYKGGIMLVDSSNFKFSKHLIEDNVKEVRDKISSTSKLDSIENIRDLNKGDFVSNAVGLLADKKDFWGDSYTDLNFWSFSNSGTGASCFIDRLPNQLLLKLIEFQKEALVRNDLKSILTNPKTTESFLEALDANNDWYGLYPRKSGSGKKTIEFDGVNPLFLEKYMEQIKKQVNIPLIKYIAHLCQKHKSEALEKLIKKKDGYNDPNFSPEIYKVLVIAVEKGELNPLHFIELLEDKLPVSNFFSRYHKLIHFYCYKSDSIEEQPTLNQQIKKTKPYIVLMWIISVIENDEKSHNIKKELLEKQNYAQYSYESLLLRQSQNMPISLEDIMAIFYTEKTYFVRRGLNQLLHLYYSKKSHETEVLYTPLKIKFSFPDFVLPIQLFAKDFHEYYMEKYCNKETQEPPNDKYKKQIEAIQIIPTNKFLYWVRDVLDKMGKFDKKYKNKWSEEDFLYDEEGNFATQWVKFILKYQLQKQ